MSKHVVVFVHGWKGKPWSERYFSAVPRWKNAEYKPFSWGEDLEKYKDEFFISNFTRWVKTANQSAKELNRMLHDLDADSIDIVAHSLGTRVVHGALSQKLSAPVNNVFLCAGAFPRAISWFTALGNMQGNIYNFASSYDNSLRLYLLNLASNPRYNGGVIGRPTAGKTQVAKGISSRLSRIHNHDVSALKLGHNDYGQRLDTLVSIAMSKNTAETLFNWETVPRFFVRGKSRVRGAKSEIIQVALNDYFSLEPNYTVDVSGYPDKKTIRAVKEFQRRNKLRADGIVGQKTWSVLVQKPVVWL